MVSKLCLFVVFFGKIATDGINHVSFDWNKFIISKKGTVNNCLLFIILIFTDRLSSIGAHSAIKSQIVTLNYEGLSIGGLIMLV